jgi:hypothetical protein
MSLSSESYPCAKVYRTRNDDLLGSVGQLSRRHQANDENDFDSYSKGGRFYVDEIQSVPVALMPLVLAASLGHGFLFPRPLELE